MRRQINRLAAITALVIGATVQAQDFVGDPPAVPVGQGCHHHHGFSLKRLCDWVCYKPLRVPHACECKMLQLTPTPPLYMYFIGEFGPRSPSLGYPVWDHFAHSGPEHCAQTQEPNGSLPITEDPVHSTEYSVPSTEHPVQTTESSKPTTED